MNDSTPAGQKERRERYYKLYVGHMLDRIGDDAGWRGPVPAANFREKLWHCLPLLYEGGEAAERAERIIAAVEPAVCHFSPMTALQLVLKHGDRLSGESTRKLLAYAESGLEWAAGEHVLFTMYNDNFAALAAFTLLIAGERLGKPDACAAGMRKLEQLRTVLTRRGTIMEFGSPTYTPITTHVLAEIANLSQSSEARELALQCETRMWAEIAVHYHPPTAQFAGPYSRAYLVDSVAHPNNVHGLLYLAFGDRIFTNPADTLFPPRERQVAHVGVETLMLPNIAWLMSGDAHCPEEIGRLLLRKTFPFDAVSTTECLPGTETLYGEEAVEHPAWSGPNTVHMTEDYALGTSAGQFYDGAITDSFHAVYRTRTPAARLEDTRAVFCRYLFGDRSPGRANTYNGRESGAEMLRDEGRKFTLQHRSTALVVYRPKPYEAKRTASMKLSVLFPLHFGELESIWLDGKELSAPEGESVTPVTVYVKDGPVLFAFKPLQLTDHGRQAAVRVERSGDYAMISFYNYEGPARSFEPEEAELTASGFVAHMSTIEASGSFEAFRRHAGSGSLDDRFTSQLQGHTRRIRYEHADARLEFAYSPRSEGILYAAVNGRPRPDPIFRAGGFDASTLPFL